MAIPDLKRYLHLIMKNVEDTARRKVFTSAEQESVCQFHKEAANDNKQFKETKIWISNSNLIRQRF